MASKVRTMRRNLHHRLQPQFLLLTPDAIPRIRIPALKSGSPLSNHVQTINQSINQWVSIDQWVSINQWVSRAWCGAVRPGGALPRRIPAIDSHRSRVPGPAEARRRAAGCPRPRRGGSRARPALRGGSNGIPWNSIDFH